jgi:hypothetical protein
MVKRMFEIQVLPEDVAPLSNVWPNMILSQHSGRNGIEFRGVGTTSEEGHQRWVKALQKHGRPFKIVGGLKGMSKSYNDPQW